MILFLKTITFLVVSFFVLCDVTVSVYNFPPGTLFALRNTFSEKLLLATFLLCCKIYSFYLLILVDFTFSMKISLSWNSIPCNFINSFCICLGIIANQSLYFYRFYQSVIQRHNFPASL